MASKEDLPRILLIIKYLEICSYFAFYNWIFFLQFILFKVFSPANSIQIFHSSPSI